MAAPGRPRKRGRRGRPPGLWSATKEVVHEFFADDATTLAASLAFYTGLSMAPILILLLWIASWFGDSAQLHLVSQVDRLMGATAAEALHLVLENADNRPDVANAAGWFGLGVLLFSASSVFAQLQHALNLTWGVRARPGLGLMSLVRKRLLSMGMVLTIGFLLLVSLALSALLSLLDVASPGDLGVGPELLRVANVVVPLVVITGLFGLIFKVLPDVAIGWKEVWVGAFLTAVLFTAGKFAIGLYLGRSDVGSAYGAAGSLVVTLVWVYYASLIVLIGAEVTQVYARRREDRIEPDEHAERIPRLPADGG